MCNQCNYSELLENAQLEATQNRLRILAIIGGNGYPLSAADIITTLQRETEINRVTVYRILDLLAAHGLVERLSSGSRAFYYGMAPNAYHPAHPHFYCKSCGQMECLEARSLTVDASGLQETFAGQIDKLEIRVDGVCKNCLRLKAFQYKKRH